MAVSRDVVTSTGVDVRIDVVGATVLVGTPDHGTAHRLVADWSRCGAAIVTSNDSANDSVNDSAELTVSGEERSLYGLATNLTIRVVGRLAGTHVLIHAAGLATEDGRVMVLVGTSGAGKTTAAGRLCEELFGYVTDELVVISPGGSVLEYPKPLSVIEESAGHAKRQYGPDQLQLRSTPDELRSGPFILLERRLDAVDPSLDDVPLVEALLDVLPHTSSVALLPHPLQTLCRLLGDGGAYRLTYAEIDGAGTLLTSLATPPTPPEWQPEPEQEPTALLWDGHYRRAPVVDAVRVGDEIVAMSTGPPVRMMGIGVTLWEAAASPATFDDLVDASVAAHGSHPEAEHLVREAAHLLVASGMLHYERPLGLDAVMAGRSTRDGDAPSDGLP